MNVLRSVRNNETAPPQSSVTRISLIGTAAVVLICLAAALDMRSS